MRRIPTAVVVVVACAAALAGCSAPGVTGGASPSASTTTAAAVDFTAAPSGTLSAWGLVSADEGGKARLAYAARRLADVDVEVDTSAFDAQKFAALVASGDVPDVVQVDRRVVAQYAAQQVIMPLDACFQAHDVSPRDHWYGSVVDDVSYRGRVWAAPQFSQPSAIILNRTVMNQAGVTDEQMDTSRPGVLLAAISRMTQQAPDTPTVLGFDPTVPGQSALWVLGMGGRLVNADGEPTLDDPANEAGIDLLKQIMHAQGGYASVKSVTDSFDTFGAGNPFVTDGVGAQLDPQWYPDVLSPYVDQLNVEAVPFRGADGQPLSVTGGSAFVIPVGAKNPGAACAWLTDLTSDAAWMAAGRADAAVRKTDGGLNTGMFTGSPTADRSIRELYVVESGNAGFDQVVSTYYDVVDRGVTFGSSPAGQDIQNQLNNAVTAVLLGDKTTKQALADAQEAAMRAYRDATATR